MSLLTHAPHFDLPAAQRLAREVYGLEATAKLLPSERDQNFLLQTPTGEKFVLKLANATEDRALLEAQNAALQHLVPFVSICPRILPAQNGAAMVSVGPYLARVMTYLPGVPLGHVPRRTPALLHDLGHRLGQVDAALQTFDHPAAHRVFHWDLAHGLTTLRQREQWLDAEVRQWTNHFATDFEQRVTPLLPHLRQSIIHNDANDYNLLIGGGDDLYTRDQSLVGLIDFGDLVHSYTVGDLALLIAYALLDQPDSLITAAQIVRGYHAALPLTEVEVAALFGLVTLRLCVSVAMAAEQQHQQPDNVYLGISQPAIRHALPQLASIHPRLAEAVFREACGWEPVRANIAVTDWLKQNAGTFTPVMDAAPFTVLDLSIGSPLLDSDPTRNAEPYLTLRINAALQQAGATVGVGGYAEARYFYTDPAFATSAGENRTVHLGIDVFAEAGTPVFAPLAGIVRACADNVAPQDYGPVIVLEHRTDADEVFYTLYGHLSRESLRALKVGQTLQAGQRLATLGEAEVNGGWTPHLHFQIITDLLELGGDFPGVARPRQRAVWQSFSPDPNLILNLPLPPVTAPTKAETLVARRERLGRNLSIAYREPLKMVRGWKQYLFDEEGHRYIDAYNNVAHVGHAHPRVVEAGRQQLGVLNTNTRYLHDHINQYAEQLTALLPEPLRVCYFVNSGSEANELAVRLARAYTGQRAMLVLEAAYHGNTNLLIDLSPYKHNGPGGLGAPEWVHAVPIPDDYRGAYKRDDPLAGAKYAGHVAAAIAEIQQRGRGLCGYIAESLPSVGGQIVLPPGYLAEVYRHVRAAGGVCIADEVQTGFGRVGTHFWGFEMQGVVPDIVVLGKPIGNGHPLGAVITTPAIAEAFNNGMEFFSTFGGNPVSCAMGLAVLEVVRAENLQAHALRVGERLLRGLRPLVESFPLVGDVRGSGLFLGVELVRDRVTLAPAPEEAAFIANRFREHGILLGTDGPYHNVVKIRPPMPFDEANAEVLVDVFEKILRADFS